MISLQILIFVKPKNETAPGDGVGEDETDTVPVASLPNVVAVNPLREQYIVMTARAELTPAGAIPLHAALAPLLTLSIACAIKSGRQKQSLVWQSTESQPLRKGLWAHLGSSEYSGVSSRLIGRLLPIKMEQTLYRNAIKKMSDKESNPYLEVWQL